MVALGVEREVDEHDAVLLDDADQQNDADQRDDTEVVMEDHQHQQRADPGRGQCRQDRDRVNEAFVENAEDDVDDDERRRDEDRLAGQRRDERIGIALEAGRQRGRLAELLLDLVNRSDGVADRYARLQVERQRHRRELALVIDDDRRHLGHIVDQGPHRYLLAVRRVDV